MRSIFVFLMGLITVGCSGALVLDAADLTPTDGPTLCADAFSCDVGFVCGTCDGSEQNCCNESTGPCSAVFPEGDCPLGLACSFGVCIGPDDGAWCDCDTGQGCENGVCISINGSNNCSSTNLNGICPGTDLCVVGNCVPCTAESACSDERPNGCCPSGATCGDDARCIPLTESAACSPSNLQGGCIAGFTCTTEGACAETMCSASEPAGTCAFGTVCTGGDCLCIPCSATHPDGCCADPTAFCSNVGQCIPFGQCMVQSDCSLGSFCNSEGSCAPLGSCVDATDCGTGFGCFNGVCEQTCTDSSECPSGSNCEGGRCVANTCTDINCNQQFRVCNDTGSFAVCSDCLNGYHEEPGAVPCVPDDCEDAGCPGSNRQCDTSGAFAVCGDCLSGFAENTERECVNCTTTANCQAGFYCREGTCTQECDPATQTMCSSSEVCTVHGQCAATAPTGSVCAAALSEGTLLEPIVVFLVDRSGSMSANFQGQTRWDAVYDVLFDPMDGVVQSLQDVVRFGLALYTGNGATCPAIDLPTNPFPATNNFSDLEPVFGNNCYGANPSNPNSGLCPASDTPTGDSIDVLVAGLQALNEPDTPKTIILATDGEPDRCEELNPQDGHVESVASSLLAFQAGIDVVPLSVGLTSADDHFQDVANAGQLGCPFETRASSPQYIDCNDVANGNASCDPLQDDQDIVPGCGPASNPDAPFFVATQTSELRDSINEIVGSRLSCVIELNTTPGILPNTAGADIRVDGDLIEPFVGWIFQNPQNTRIELVGEACDRVTDGNSHVISIEFEACTISG